VVEDSTITMIDRKCSWSVHGLSCHMGWMALHLSPSYPSALFICILVRKPASLSGGEEDPNSFGKWKHFSR
jgi:hypothetical protein